MGRTVETSCGKLEGTEDRGIQVFRGIPYAQPPVGALRFQSPRPPEPWSGLRDATTFGLSAPQNPMLLQALPGMDVGAQGEDCLSLNVYSPGLDDARRPVMVWIHGGGFFIGSGSQIIYDGVPLATRGDVVVVTINYRLGALGFLRCEALGASGNAGFEDQIAALRWVQDNIAQFGGDPGNVTIFGESAGGMSVGALLGTPSARGLFQRAILQSGAAHNVHTPAAADRICADFLNELSIDPSQAMKLRDLPSKALLEAQMQLVARGFGSDTLLPFQPVVDGQTLPAQPLEAIREGLSEGISLLVGTCRDEWKLFAAMDFELPKLTEAELAARIEARFPSAGLSDFYRCAAAADTPRDRFIAFETDRIFRIPAIRLAEAQSAHARDVSMYRLDWESPAFGGVLGACHAIDLAFVFGVTDKPGIDTFIGGGSEAQGLSASMMDAWLSFARSGRPGHTKLPEWPAYSRDERASMVFGRECRLDRDAAAAEREAWRGLL